MIRPQSVPHLPGVPVLDVDGDIIGSVDRVYIHENTGAPRWVSIHSHFDAAPHAFAPLDLARFDDRPGPTLHVGLPRAVIENAPVITGVDTLSADDVHSLRSYYSGVVPAAVPAAVGVPSVRLDDDADVGVMRSEERLRVSAISVPKERIRFEKVIVTEEKTMTVTVRREELRTFREPLSENGQDDVAAGSSAKTELELVLHEERVVVTTEVVPVERVRVRVASVVEDLPVTDTVRKERVDIDTTAH